MKKIGISCELESLVRHAHVVSMKEGSTVPTCRIWSGSFKTVLSRCCTLFCFDRRRINNKEIEILWE
jgi:hypothetical protein